MCIAFKFGGGEFGFVTVGGSQVVWCGEGDQPTQLNAWVQVMFLELLFTNHVPSLYYIIHKINFDHIMIS